MGQTFRFTLYNQPDLPPFGAQWSTKSGNHPWTLTSKPSVSIPSGATSIIQTDTIFLPGTYTVEYTVTATGSSVFTLGLAFDKTNHTVSCGSGSESNSGSGTFSGDFTVVVTAESQGAEISFGNFGPSSRVCTIDYLRITNMTGYRISEPIGWKDATLKLERHPEFHSLIEYFDGSFVFYGNNGTIDGGAEYIRSILSIYGFDAELEIFIDLSVDGGATYEELYNGLLDLESMQETKDNKISIPILRNDMWSRFIARKDTPVDIRSTTDLDGHPVTPCEIVDLNLTPQKVRQVFIANYTEAVPDISGGGNHQYTIQGGEYGIISFEHVIQDEIKKSYNYVNTDDPDRPFEMFDVEYGGSYRFQFNLNISSTASGNGGSAPVGIGMRFQINDDTPITVTGTNIGTPGVDESGRFSFDQTYTLKAHDLIRIYFINTSGSPVTFYAFTGNLASSGTRNLTVTADTVYPSSSAQGFLIHDVMYAVIERICGRPRPTRVR
jgi:hypothetical protein